MAVEVVVVVVVVVVLVVVPSSSSTRSSADAVVGESRILDASGGEKEAPR